VAAQGMCALWCLTLCAFFVCLLCVPCLCSLVVCLQVYVWSRRNPFVQMSFLGLFNFTAPYLPWVSPDPRPPSSDQKQRVQQK